MATPKPRDHMARVSCTDEVWSQFKHLAAADGWQPVNEYLGELVTKEVARQARLQSRADDATARKVLAALDEAKALRDDLEGITARLEQLAAARAPAGAEAAADPDDWSRFRLERPAGEPTDIPEWEP